MIRVPIAFTRGFGGPWLAALLESEPARGPIAARARGLASSFASLRLVPPLSVLPQDTPWKVYAVFGDKRTLFLRALRAYAERKGASAAKALLSSQSLRDSITNFLRHAVESATQKGSARGCLMVCVAPLVNDAEVQRFLQSTVADGAALVECRFRDGISAGNIPPDFPVAVRAVQVTDFARGLTMRARIGTPRKTLLKDAEEAADLVLQPRRV